MIPPIGSAMQSTMAEISRPKCLLPYCPNSSHLVFGNDVPVDPVNPRMHPLAILSYIYIVAHAFAKFQGYRVNYERDVFLSCALCPCCPVATLMPVGMRVPNDSPL
jgi:hypothetical protein